MHTVKNSFPLSIRVGNAIVCYARYLGKAFWPSRLALIYPHPGTSLRTWEVLAALVLLLAVTALVLRERRQPVSTGGMVLVSGDHGAHDRTGAGG